MSFYNHSFPTNPNGSTNLLQIIFLFLLQQQQQTTTTTTNEGAASYQGYNFYQKYIQEQYNNPAVTVEQRNVTNFVRFGIDYGPASIWSFTPPPTGSMKRVIRYEITFQYQTNILLAYSLDGSEQLEIGASLFLCLFSCFVCFFCLFSLFVFFLAMFVSCFCFLI